MEQDTTHLQVAIEMNGHEEEETTSYSQQQQQQQQQQKFKQVDSFLVVSNKGNEESNNNKELETEMVNIDIEQHMDETDSDQGTPYGDDSRSLITEKGELVNGVNQETSLSLSLSLALTEKRRKSTDSGVSNSTSASNGRACRFCWGDDGELIPSGCKCIGLNIHEDCLLKWAKTNHRKEKIVCEVCLSSYDLELVQKIDLMLKERKSRSEKRRKRDEKLAKLVFYLSMCLMIVAVLLVLGYLVVFILSLVHDQK